MYRIDYGYPRLISMAWKGVPDNIDSVFAWRNGKTYFFKGDKYYRLDDRNVKVSYGYPRVISENWSSCPAAIRGVSDSGAKSVLFKGQVSVVVVALLSFISLFS